MFELGHETESRVSGGSIRTATVEAVEEGGRRVRVTMEGAGVDEGGFGADWVEIAVPGTPTPGTRVLLAVEDTGRRYVIGILDGGRPRGSLGSAGPGPRPTDERRMELARGASVRVDGPPEAERLRLFSGDDRLLLEYDTATGRLRLDAPSGDLELVSAEGDIVLDAAGAVRISGHSVEATGSSHVHLAVPHAGATAAGGATSSMLRLDPSAARIASPHLGVTSRSGSVRMEEARYRGSRLAARVDRLEIVAERIERVVDQLHETVGRAYTTVRELLEVRARRVRTLVESTWQATAGRAFLRSKEEFKVKGETIHLG